MLNQLNLGYIEIINTNIHRQVKHGEGCVDILHNETQLLHHHWGYYHSTFEKQSISVILKCIILVEDFVSQHKDGPEGLRQIIPVLGIFTEVFISFFFFFYLSFWNIQFVNLDINKHLDYAYHQSYKQWYLTPLPLGCYKHFNISQAGNNQLKKHVYFLVGYFTFYEFSFQNTFVVI